jgi:hypothetical protein
MSVRSFSLALVACLSLGAAAHAQAPAGYSQVASGTVPIAQQPQMNFERVSGRSNPAASYFGGATAAALAQRPVRPLPPPPQAVNVRPVGKPFSGVRQASAISPYLGLDARETETSLPNYFLYVKPQLDQQRINQVQQAEYRRLQQQIGAATAPGVVTNPHGGIPTTGHSAQFMNNGGYYPTLRR